MLDDSVRTKGVSVRSQIVTSVRVAIANGELKTGDKLMSMNELAITLRTSNVIIAQAYHQLEVLGLVKGMTPYGVFVKAGASERCRKELIQEVVSKLCRVISEGKEAGITADDLKKMCSEGYGLAKGSNSEKVAGIDVKKVGKGKRHKLNCSVKEDKIKRDHSGGVR